MPDGQDDLRGFKEFARVQVYAAQHMRPVRAAAEFHIGHALLETVFPAERLDLGAQAFDHGHQPEGADMRVGIGEDLRRGTGGHKFGEHLPAEKARVLDLAVELAVRKCAGAAFAVLDVGLRIELAAAPEAPGVLCPLPDHLAAVEDDRAQAQLGQNQACEQAAGARADDDRTQPGRARRRRGGAIGCVGCGAHVGIAAHPPESRRFVAQHDVHDIGFQDGRLAPGVVGPFPD